MRVRRIRTPSKSLFIWLFKSALKLLKNAQPVRLNSFVNISPRTEWHAASDSSEHLHQSKIQNHCQTRFTELIVPLCKSRVNPAFSFQDFIGTDNITDARRKHALTFGTPVDCVWAIHAEKDHQISLSFPEGGWKLKHPNDCHLNYIQARRALEFILESVQVNLKWRFWCLYEGFFEQCQ